MAHAGPSPSVQVHPYLLRVLGIDPLLAHTIGRGKIADTQHAEDAHHYVVRIVQKMEGQRRCILSASFRHIITRTTPG